MLAGKIERNQANRDRIDYIRRKRYEFNLVGNSCKLGKLVLVNNVFRFKDAYKALA